MSKMERRSAQRLGRRQLLQAAPGAGLALTCATACKTSSPAENSQSTALVTAIEPPALANHKVVEERFTLGRRWRTFDPFLFCVHHNDNYPAGNAELGPIDSLKGRSLGRDFSAQGGWSMYHGRQVPGFPRHPHRGFETITVTRKGFIDHSDSLGATARYGQGDVQWMTAGHGIAHAEMFPLLYPNRRNPAELFQIWLNLPARNKLVQPYFSMFWSEHVPERETADSTGKKTTVRTIAGTQNAQQPPPDSWASQANSNVVIRTVTMEAGARWTLPAAPSSVTRCLYFFRGSRFSCGGEAVRVGTGVKVTPTKSVEIANGDAPGELLLLQGTPIGEPVIQRGPFVMNTPDEIQQAVREYQRGAFGAWPWPGDAPVHPRELRHFAQHADGRQERPG